MKHVPIPALMLALALSVVPASTIPAMTAGSSSSETMATTAMPAYMAADKLIKEEKYDEAIAALNAMKKPEDADVLNLLGYAHRKAGKIDESISYYLKGLQTAPKHKGIHAYLGEAYLMKKDLAKAEALAATLKGLCGDNPCDEYKELAAAIDTYKSANKDEAAGKEEKKSEGS